MDRAELRVWTELAGATINPNIYGHFAEHLGRCVYEGIWVGRGSRIPNEAGLRLDVLAALKQLRAPVIRWPGGCFADAYHWRDGVGPQKARPETLNIWWRQAEPNTFGTDEFMRLCRAVGCAPYICLNVGSGTPREALEWLEYCNFGGDSTLARLRAQHNDGAPAPYGVRYWGVGNENWGCGGRFRAEDYAKEYVRFATYLRQLDPEIELIACGFSPCDQDPERRAWNHDFCHEMVHADLIDHLSIHRYFQRGTGAKFTDSEFQALFGDVLALERDLLATDRLLGYFYPDKHIGLAVDEWGVWHPSATIDSGLEQENTLRDAVLAGACLNLFNRYAHRVTMANLAQTVNVLQSVANTDGARMYVTPTYHVFDMMRPHMGARVLQHELECGEYEARPVSMGRKRPVPVLSASVSRSGRRVSVTVANQSIDSDVEARIALRDATISSVSGRELGADDPRLGNSFDNPKAVSPKRVRLELRGGEVTHVFPAHSFTALRLTLE